MPDLVNARSDSAKIAAPSGTASGVVKRLQSRKPSQPLPLPHRFGRYRLTKLLAQGGMAQIYLAKSFGAEGFVKQLVIKRLDPRLSNEPYFTDLFINEAKLLVTLSHGNIVPVFDFGRVGEDLYIAMEHVAGVSLHGLMAHLAVHERHLDPQLAAYITAEVCKGLHYAHRKADASGRIAGIVHRDIKPTNVLLSTEGEVKIVDFGVAKLAGRLEQRGRLAGTLGYMSPEQANRKNVDRRTDIFSTGLVLFELLLGRRVYNAVSPREVLAQARAAQMPELPERVPRELAQVAEFATKIKPSERYASAYEMEQALAEYLVLARAATAIFDTQSPSFKLAELMAELGLRESAKAEDAAFDTVDDEHDVPSIGDSDVVDGSMAGELPASGPPVPGAGLPNLDKPPDIELMRDAAETFQSELFTRVLLEDLEGRPSRKLMIWAIAVGVAALLVVGALVFLLLRDRTKDGDASAAGSGSAGAGSAGSAAARVAAGSGSAEGPSGGSGSGSIPIRVRLRTTPVAGSGSGSTASLSAAASATAGSGSGSAAGSGDAVGSGNAGAKKPRKGRRRRWRSRYGYLNINSIPWSRVRVDGRLLRRPTPILKLRLRRGWHRIELINKEIGARRRLRVWIRGGKTTWRVIKLRKR